MRTPQLETETNQTAEGPFRRIEHHMIAERAFMHFEARGRQHGRALDDWLRAESELRAEYMGHRQPR